MFLPEWLKITVGTFAMIVFALSLFARKYPHVAWLQQFDFQKNLSQGQRDRMRRSAQAIVAAEMILTGVIIPLAYLAVKIMFFNPPEPRELVILFALSALLIGAGIMTLVRNR